VNERKTRGLFIGDVYCILSIYSWWSILKIKVFKSKNKVWNYTTKNRGYLHLNLATDNSVAKFSNGFATDYTYIIFLILATDFSNG
jgi:hypothetical protein